MLSVASIIWFYHEYKGVWSEGSSGDGKIVIFAPQVSTYTHAKFLCGSWVFYKNGDKFG